MALTDAGNPILVFDIINGNDQEYPFEGKVYVSIAPGQPCIEVGIPWTGAVNFYPTIATGGNYVVVLFLSPRSGSGLNTFWDIYYNFSTDNGATWPWWPMNLTSSITDYNNSLPQIAKRLDASLNRFFFAFGHYIPYPYYEPIYNILSGGPAYPCRWYVGYNPVVPGVEEGHYQKPKKINLSVSPNPIANRAVVSYTIPASGVVSLKIYSADGRLVKTLEQGYRLTGDYTLRIETGELPNGTYILVLDTIKGSDSEILIVIH